MASSPAHMRTLYRSLLRELPPRPILLAPRSPAHSHIREVFSSSPSASLYTAATSSPTSRPTAVAEQVVAYLRSQRMYATLLERYNPGMDMDEEERVRLSARRVGMNLPVSYVKESE